MKWIKKSKLDISKKELLDYIDEILEVLEERRYFDVRLMLYQLRRDIEEAEENPFTEHGIIPGFMPGIEEK
jgi:hypothetical protein